MYDFDGNPIGHDDWARLFADTDRRRVAFTQLGDVEVSTVWLGLDHRFPPPLMPPGAPLIYETMVFGGDHDEYTERYPNRVAALAGHDRIEAMVRDTIAARHE
jgi:hypothetical protein